jgi:hypothetical protein
VRTQLAITVVASFGTVACADGGNVTHDLVATETCLEEKGYRPEVWPPNELPFLGGPAADGVLRFESGDTEVGIAFNAEAEEAEQRVEALETTASEWSPNPWFDVFERRKNVVYWARGGSSDQPMNDVNDCLGD